MTGIDGINIFKADVLATLFVGLWFLLFLCSCDSVGKAAMEMVKYVVSLKRSWHYGRRVLLSTVSEEISTNCS